MAGITVGIFLQIILVLGLGFPEVTGRRDFGDRLAGPQAGSIDIGDGVFGDALLLVAGVVDRRTVAHPDIVALAVARRRIVDLEKALQQRAIADHRRQELDLVGL